MRKWLFLFIIIPLLFLQVIFSYPLKSSAQSIAAKKEEIKVLDNQIKTEINKLQELESRISKIKAVQNARIQNLVLVYSSMSPASAAAILPHINKEIAVYILSSMPARKASAIISNMSTGDAVYFTNKIAGK